MNLPQNQAGVSIIGLIIVMMIVGAMTAALVPFLLSKSTQSMQSGDYQDLLKARTAITGYALSNGNLPGPVGGIMPAVTLGVNNWGVYGKENPFRMDVNDALKATVSLKALCAAAQTEMSNASALPRVCNVTTGSTCSAANSSAAAFVLYSTGTDRIPNMNNAANSRIYDSETRGIDSSVGITHYDDQVVAYPLSSLVKDCAKSGAVFPVCNVNATPSTVAASGIFSLTASCSNSPGSLVLRCSNTLSGGTACSPSPPTITNNIASSVTAPSNPGTYYYFVKATNELGTGAEAYATVTVPGNLMSNGDFSTNNLASFPVHYAYADASLNQIIDGVNLPVVANSWTFSGGAGLSANGTAWGGNASSIGSSYFAFLQGGTGVISQTITGGAGNYTISFYLTPRAYNCPTCQSVAVTFDGAAVGAAIKPPNNGLWTLYTISAPSLSGTFSHTLSFSGQYVGASDATVFLAKVSVTGPF